MRLIIKNLASFYRKILMLFFSLSVVAKDFEVREFQTWMTYQLQTIGNYDQNTGVTDDF